MGSEMGVIVKGLHNEYLTHTHRHTHKIDKNGEVWGGSIDFITIGVLII